MLLAPNLNRFGNTVHLFLSYFVGQEEEETKSSFPAIL